MALAASQLSSLGSLAQSGRSARLPSLPGASSQASSQRHRTTTRRRDASISRSPVSLRASYSSQEESSAKASNDGFSAHHLCTQLKKAVVAGLVALEVVAPIPWNLPAVIDAVSVSSPAAHAVLLSPDTKVPKNAEVALRRAVPVVNQNLRKIQDDLEEIFLLLRIPQRKPYGSMESSVKRAITLGEGSKEALIAAIPAERQPEGQALIDSILTDQRRGLPGLLIAVQERDPDAISIRLASSLDKISQLAVLQAPGLQFLIPPQYSALPKLAGRAVVEFSVEKKDGAPFVIKNGADTTPTATVLAVLDGYSAPLTAGNFAKLVVANEFDGTSVKSTSQAVLGEAKSADSLATSTPELPLELMPSGEFQPLYKTGLEVADGELPVLPMSVFGALVMSHGPSSDVTNSPSQFFIYLYDKRNSGLGGLAFDEGQFSVFGYVTAGKDILPQIKTGDVIKSARIISGADRLVLP